jgi:hypothetical protein
VVDPHKVYQLDFDINERANEVGWSFVDSNSLPSEYDLRKFGEKSRSAKRVPHFCGGSESIKTYCPPCLRKDKKTPDTSDRQTVKDQLKKLISEEESVPEHQGPAFVLACFQYFLSILVFWKSITTGAAAACSAVVTQIWVEHGYRTAFRFIEKLRQKLVSMASSQASQQQLSELLSHKYAPALTEAVLEINKEITDERWQRNLKDKNEKDSWDGYKGRWDRNRKRK